MKVLDLKGYKSLRAYNVFNTLMLGLKMLPAYISEGYKEFYDRIESMSEESQLVMIQEAVKFVELQEDEIKAVVCFCCDKNGVPYTAENVKNLSHIEIMNCVVAVCVEIAKIKVDYVSESEKKNLEISPLM